MTENDPEVVSDDVEIYDGAPTFDRAQALEDGRQDDDTDPEDQETYDEEESDSE